MLPPRPPSPGPGHFRLGDRPPPPRRHQEPACTDVLWPPVVVLLRPTPSRNGRAQRVMAGPAPRAIRARRQSSPSLILEEPMSTTSTAKASGLGTAAPGRSLLQTSAAGAAAATLVNAALCAGGRAADVSFTVSSALMAQVGIVPIVLTTLLAFAVGSALLALAARRSRRWVRAVLIAAALIAVVSAGAPLAAAQDTTTGVPWP